MADQSRTKVVVLCPHPEERAPGQRLKYEQYFPSWESAGYQVDVRPFWDDEAWSILYSPGNWLRKFRCFTRGLTRRRRDLVAALEADIVYLFLHAVPIGPPLLERRLHQAGIPLVYDIDDLIYLPHQNRANPFMRWLRSKRKVTELMQMADHVIVCTPYLEEFAKNHNENVTKISSTINTDRYLPKAHRNHVDGVVVGWSGSHSTSPYLHLLDDVLRELQRVDGIGVHVIGDADFAIDGVSLSAKEWELQSEVQDMSIFDIGVYPLPHEEWVLGKSGLKALQYMALGIPPVAQRIGTNIEIIEDGVNGFLADDRDEWLAKLRRLIYEPDLRRTLGDRARQTVLERYSVAANEPTYLAILEGVAHET